MSDAEIQVGHTPREAATADVLAHPLKCYVNDPMQEGFHILGGEDDDIIVAENIYTEELSTLFAAAPSLLTAARAALTVLEAPISARMLPDAPAMLRSAIKEATS